MSLTNTPDGLAAAVIAQAWRDAGLPHAAGRSGGQMARALPLTRREAMNARLFLTAPEGEWAEARRTWCDLAGLDADAVADKARRLGA